jgi:hypothetical protein
MPATRRRQSLPSPRVGERDATLIADGVMAIIRKQETAAPAIEGRITLG